MHALASLPEATQDNMPQVEWLAEQASHYLTADSTPAKMYQFVKSHYHNNADKNDWESTRDAVYQRYQIDQRDGYNYQQPFDAGINFAASLVSLFYGQGDIVRTIKIGTLSGWDSDNPTATWGGLLGFIIGHQAVVEAFEQPNVPTPIGSIGPGAPSLTTSPASLGKIVLAIWDNERLVPLIASWWKKWVDRWINVTIIGIG